MYGSDSDSLSQRSDAYPELEVSPISDQSVSPILFRASKGLLIPQMVLNDQDASKTPSFDQRSTGSPSVPIHHARSFQHVFSEAVSSVSSPSSRYNPMGFPSDQSFGADSHARFGRRSESLLLQFESTNSRLKSPEACSLNCPIGYDVILEARNAIPDKFSTIEETEMTSLDQSTDPPNERAAFIHGDSPFLSPFASHITEPPLTPFLKPTGLKVKPKRIYPVIKLPKARRGQPPVVGRPPGWAITGARWLPSAEWNAIDVDEEIQRIIWEDFDAIPATPEASHIHVVVLLEAYGLMVRCGIKGKDCPPTGTFVVVEFVEHSRFSGFELGQVLHGGPRNELDEMPNSVFERKFEYGEIFPIHWLARRAVKTEVRILKLMQMRARSRLPYCNQVMRTWGFDTFVLDASYQFDGTCLILHCKNVNPYMDKVLPFLDHVFNCRVIVMCEAGF